jgi:hypothetical protein
VKTIFFGICLLIGVVLINDALQAKTNPKFAIGDKVNINREWFTDAHTDIAGPGVIVAIRKRRDGDIIVKVRWDSRRFYKFYEYTSEALTKVEGE